MNDINVDMFFVLSFIFIFGNVHVYGANHVSVEDLNDKLYKMQAELLKINERLIVSEATNQKLQEEYFHINKRLQDDLSKFDQTQKETEKTNQRFLGEIHTMKQRLVASENQNQQLQTEIQTLKEETMNDRDARLSNKMEEVYQKVGGKPQAAKIDGKDMKWDIGLHKRLLMPDSNHIVAFTAVLTHDVTLGYHQAIEFDKVITNIGNAYDSNDGHFVAPIRGIYLLSISLFSINANNVNPIEIVQNGIQLAVVHVFPQIYGIGGQTVVVLLEKGDKIWIRRFRNLTGSASLYGRPNEPYNSFSGVLLKEM